MQLIDLTGRKFGRWTVLSLHPERMRYGKAGHAVIALWRCACDCGSERLVFGSNLRRGLSTSCGCFKLEQLVKRSTKHGHARRGNHTSIYDRWVSMRQRCFDPNHKSYSDYGGRGITVCDRWHFGGAREHPFKCLLADKGDAPPGLSLDRINNDGNYSPDNCRWATASEQVHNRRPSKRKKRKGRRSSLTELEQYAAVVAARGAP